MNREKDLKGGKTEPTDAGIAHKQMTGKVVLSYTIGKRFVLLVKLLQIFLGRLSIRLKFSTKHLIYPVLTHQLFSLFIYRYIRAQLCAIAQPSFYSVFFIVFGP